MQILPTCTKNNHENTIKASKIDPLAKNQPYTRVCLTISANRPSREKISDLSSCVRSCDDKNECILYLFI